MIDRGGRAMDKSIDQVPRRISLPVLSYRETVEQFGDHSAPSTPSAPAAAPLPPPQPPVGALAAHVNREPTAHLSPEQRALEEKIVAALREVYDPEIPINIYDLGLIYGILIGPENAITVQMTLTAPGCPVAGAIVAEVEQRVQTLSEVKSVNVDLVWEPPWHRDMLSEVARLELGL